MVNWSNTWLEKLKKNNVKIKLWSKRKDFKYVLCKLCTCELKYGKLGFQALVQHSVKERHQSVSKDRFSNNARCITDGFMQAVAVSDQLIHN